MASIVKAVFKGFSRFLRRIENIVLNQETIHFIEESEEGYL